MSWASAFILGFGEFLHNLIYQRMACPCNSHDQSTSDKSIGLAAFFCRFCDLFCLFAVHGTAFVKTIDFAVDSLSRVDLLGLFELRLKLFQVRNRLVVLVAAEIDLVIVFLCHNYLLLRD